MSATKSVSNPRPGFPLSSGQAAFLIAAVLTGILVVMGITGTPWPHWLLVLTNIL